MDLVGAVGEAGPAACWYMLASGVSVEYPSAPWTWIERSTIRPSALATKCLAIDTSDLKSSLLSMR